MDLEGRNPDTNESILLSNLRKQLQNSSVNTTAKFYLGSAIEVANSNLAELVSEEHVEKPEDDPEAAR